MFITILLFAYIGIAMIILVPVSFIPMLLYFLGLRKPMAMVIYRIAQMWALSIISITGTKVTVTGRENIPKKGGMAFVSNHCGYFDIILMLAYSGRPFGFVAKKELVYIPFLNFWIYALGGLFIDRKNVRKAIKTINRGVQRIKSGNSMIIFPEGTRSKGRGLLPFHPGSLKIATSAEAPIIPVAIEGSYDIFEKNGRFTKAFVKLTFIKPIETAGLPPEERKHVLSDRIYKAIGEQLSENS